MMTETLRNSGVLTAALLVSGGCEQALDIPERGLAPNVVCDDGQCRCAARWERCGSPLEQGCTIDTQSDPLHCGGCGQSCLGGSCVAGRCEPLVIGASNDELPGPQLLTMELAADESHAYLAFGSVIARVEWKNAKEAQQPTPMQLPTTGIIRDLKWREGALWWLEAAMPLTGSRVCRSENLAASPPVASCSTMTGTPTRLALQSANRAFVTVSDAGGASPLVRIEFDGSQFSQETIVPPSNASVDEVGDVVADEQSVFAVVRRTVNGNTAWAIVEVSPEASNASQDDELATGISRTAPLALSESTLFYLLSNGTARGDFVASPRNGGAKRSTSVALLRDMDVTSSGAPIITSTAGALLRAKVADDALETELLHARVQQSFGPVTVKPFELNGDTIEVALFFEFVENQLLRLPLYAP